MTIGPIAARGRDSYSQQLLIQLTPWLELIKAIAEKFKGNVLLVVSIYSLLHDL